jgi:hypothetical protein
VEHRHHLHSDGGRIPVPVGVLLAAIGLYGVLAYTVARRTAAIGIRMAIGARSGNVQWLMLRESLVTALLGMLVGVPPALTFPRGAPRGWTRWSRIGTATKESVITKLFCV